MKLTDDRIDEYCTSFGVKLTEHQREILKRCMESEELTVIMRPRRGYMEAQYMLHILNAVLNGKE